MAARSLYLTNLLKFLFFGFCLLFVACSSGSQQQGLEEMPGDSSEDLDGFDEEPADESGAGDDSIENDTDPIAAFKDSFDSLDEESGSDSSDLQALEAEPKSRQPIFHNNHPQRRVWYVSRDRIPVHQQPNEGSRVVGFKVRGDHMLGYPQEKWVRVGYQAYIQSWLLSTQPVKIQERPASWQ